ncbi:aspartyl protease family protein [Brucella sp. IR073]|uniref:aspartyl protease family protein n=1 Tax=unclassified Brucella TaxID=2632610 RepID=UPI003B987B2F
MKSGGICLLFVALACLGQAHAAENPDRNDLSGYLDNRGAVIMPYTLDPNGQMEIDAVLCPAREQCLGVPLQFDSGAPDNNINAALKERLSLKGDEKTIAKFYLGALPPVSAFPVSFSKEGMRGSYIGAGWIEKLGLWFNFGTREVYGKVPSGAVADYVKGSALKYRVIPLKSLDAYRYVTVSINGKKPVNFLIDTGAAVSLIDKDYAQSLSLGFNDRHCLTMGSQAGESKTCLTHDILSLKAEDEPLPAYLPKGFGYLDMSFVIPPLKIKGILGLDWLERTGAIMALAENRLYVPVTDGSA